MRALLALVLLGGCLGAGSGGGSGGGVRPGVMPMLSELPADPAKRDAVLDSSNQVAGPERRQGLTKKERAAETTAATAAAILGGLLSHTKSVTIGAASQFDENPLIAPDAVPPPPRPSADDKANAKTNDKATGKPDAAAKPDTQWTDDPGPSNADLIPWIKVK
jgi:hypothetical protein